MARTRWSIFSYWSNKAKNGGGGGASDYNDLTGKPKINGVEVIGNKTGQDYELYNVINSSTHRTIEGYGVPELTDEQITSAYNFIVAGKHVVINDAYDLIYISVEEATNTDGIAIKVLFRDVLVLTYKLGGIIEATKVISNNDTNLFEYTYTNSETSLEKTIKGE